MNALPNASFPPPDTEGSPEGQLARLRKAVPEPPELDRFVEDFISGREPQTTQWIRLASLVASQSFSCDIVIRVLRPNEKVASGTLPIDKLGVSIARKVGAKYSPGRLKRVEGGMGSLGFNPDRPEASRERFSFDKSFLPATARVLLIGDHETPAPTVEAICKAVQDQLPNAEVKSFSLHWLEEHFKSAPLDDRYFLTSESPLSVLSRQSNPHRPEVASDASSEKPQAMVLPLVTARTVEPEQVPLAKPEAPIRTPSTSVDRKPAPVKKPRIPSWAVMMALGVIVLGIGLGVLAERRGMFSARFEGADASVIPEPREVPMVETPPVQPSRSVPAPVADAGPNGPQGIITVPSAGLRAGPSLDAKALRMSVRGNERVTILKRRASDAGPSWVQIATKGGTVGWVWASVVREAKRH